MDFAKNCLLYFSVFMLSLAYSCTEGRVHRYRRDIERQYECTDLKITNRTECEMIMYNPVLQRSYQKLQQALLRDIKEAKLAGQFPSYRRKRSLTSCPEMNAEYLRTHTQEGSRSLSPYVQELQHDRFRIPEYIFQSRCLCSGCISPEDGLEDSSYESVPLNVKINVLRSYNGGPLKLDKEVVTVGCTCVVPRVI